MGADGFYSCVVFVDNDTSTFPPDAVLGKVRNQTGCLYFGAGEPAVASNGKRISCAAGTWKVAVFRDADGLVFRVAPSYEQASNKFSDSPLLDRK